MSDSYKLYSQFIKGLFGEATPGGRVYVHNFTSPYPTIADRVRERYSARVKVTGMRFTANESDGMKTTLDFVAETRELAEDCAAWLAEEMAERQSEDSE